MLIFLLFLTSCQEPKVVTPGPVVPTERQVFADSCSGCSFRVLKKITGSSSGNSLKQGDHLIVKGSATGDGICHSGSISFQCQPMVVIENRTLRCSSGTVSTSVASAPAVSTPAVSTPAVSTPAVSTPAVSTPAVSTPAVSTPAVSTTVASPQFRSGEFHIFDNRTESFLSLVIDKPNNYPCSISCRCKD